MTPFLPKDYSAEFGNSLASENWEESWIWTSSVSPRCQCQSPGCPSYQHCAWPFFFPWGFGSLEAVYSILTLSLKTVLGYNNKWILKWFFFPVKWLSWYLRNGQEIAILLWRVSKVGNKDLLELEVLLPFENENPHCLVAFFPFLPFSSLT